MKYLIIFISVISLVSCRKYLDEKPELGLTTPNTLAEYQAILDAEEIWDFTAPQIGDLSSDDYSFRPTFPLSGVSGNAANAFEWKPNTWDSDRAPEWEEDYTAIYYANVVLDGLRTFETNNDADLLKKNNMIGHALFVRAHMHYSLEEIFGQPYKPASAATDLGIPIRTNVNLEETITRATVAEVYEQIIADLEEAIPLLPVTSPSVTRPTRAAGYALLARVYLTKQDYPKALEAANQCIQNSGSKSLIDFNNSLIRKTGRDPFHPRDFNIVTNPVSEILYLVEPVSYGVFFSANLGAAPNVAIDSNLYNSYHVDDWRKTLYFQPRTTPAPLITYYVKTDFRADPLRRFYGLALDEVYLTRAECLAREGNTIAAMECLDSLLVKRFKTGTYVPYSPASADEALSIVLKERRKELILRGIRWTDLRRLNQDPRFAVTLKRDFWPNIAPLPPNDLRYTFLIPQGEISSSGIQQNPR